MTTEIIEDATFEEAPSEIVPIGSDEQGLIPVDAQHYVVAGMGTLAAMSDAEYDRRKAIMLKGQERVRDLMLTLMTEGEDYGKVPGIARPFLHLPGAEKMGNFFGLACRQEADRIAGDGLIAPPLAYHVRTYVHVGSFDGPVVAMGYGEANSWEEKYRWRNEEPTCPECGRKGLIKRKSPAQMAGKWNCPNWGGKGGCNRVFEPNDERIKTGGKVENTDPHSLAETLIQMAGKRSFVAAIRRATGTSGLFTQDEDSPSVQQQSAELGPVDGVAPPVITKAAPEMTVAPGGKSSTPTPEQITRLRKLSKEKDLGPEKVAAIIERVAGKTCPPLTGDRREQGLLLLAFISSTLTANELGAVLMAIDTGELPDEPPGEEDVFALHPTMEDAFSKEANA